MTNLRILILSNSPHVPTGYGRQTKYLCEIAKDIGVDVGVVALYGLQGAPITWREVPIFPRRRNVYCLDVIRHYVEYFNADAVISLYDLWHFPLETRQAISVPWIAMVPVEGTPLRGHLPKLLRTAEYIVSYSPFGARELWKVGLDNVYIRHAVDVDVFCPGDQAGARESLGMPQDKFIVTMVAMNKGGQPYRKAWPEMMVAWSEFQQQHPDSLFYCHTNKIPSAPTHDSGFRFGPMIEELGIPWSSMAFPDEANFAVGIPDDEMAKIYQASDVVVLPSMAEGFGLPVIEAQACGVPVVAHDCSAMQDLVEYGRLIKRGEELWMPERSYWWYRPRPDDIVDSLNEVRGMLGRDAEREEAQAHGVQKMSQYSLDAIRPKWAEFLSKVEEELW